MRGWALALGLAFMAGCAKGPATETTPSPVGRVPAVVVFGSAEYVDWDAVGDATLRGERAVVWDATAALGLPRPFTSLLVEMRCEGTVQEGEYRWPHLLASAAYDNGARNPFEASGGGSHGCEPVSFDLTADAVDGIGSLKTLQADAPLGNTYTLGANLRIEYAASLFTDGDLPDGYSAWPAPTA